MSRFRTACTLLVVSLSFLSFAPPPPASSVANSTWGGTDSDGDAYEFYFHPDGHVRYSTNPGSATAASYDSKADVWSQNGNTVVVVLRKYSTYLSTIRGNTMEGEAWNRNDASWSYTWKMRGKGDLRSKTEPRIRMEEGR
ncbi:hypothetical protein [Flaviaesturariibacter amylovorans]|uniref:Uncharacterized protein n=1 Tax=Flaviaesturariibacter amylovorans TaxID=1084520 RepID=A0ABP8G642_9BACT